MAYHELHGAVPTNLPAAYRLRFSMRDGSRNPVTGLHTSIDVWRSRRGESPAVQIVTAGAGRTVTQVDATNMPGVYELTMQAADVDRPGAATFRFVGAGAEDLLLFVPFLPRETYVGGA